MPNQPHPSGHDNFEPDHDDLWPGDGPDNLRPGDLTLAQLAGALRAHAEGSYGNEAAVGLLIDTDRWLRRPDFLACIEVTRWPSGRLLAVIDWHQVRNADLFGSSGELQLLHLAGELAGIDSGIPLLELVSGLDDRNFPLVLQAISHGHHGHDYRRRM